MPSKIMGWHIQKRKCASGSQEMCEEYKEAASLEERERYQAAYFEGVLRVVLKGRPCRSSQHRLVEVLVCTPDTFIDFGMLSITSMTLLY